jgi:cytochrome c5
MSLRTLQENHAYGPQKFGPPVQNDFCNSICHEQTSFTGPTKRKAASWRPLSFESGILFEAATLSHAILLILALEI